MSFEFSLTIVLVFLVPGSVALLALSLGSPYVATVVTSALTSASGPSVTLLLSACFLLGAVLDSLRTVLLDRSIDRVLRQRPGDFLSHLTEKNLPVFTMLVDRISGYYRLNSNLLLAFLLLFGIDLYINGRSWSTLILVILIVMMAVRSVHARSEALWAMSRFAEASSRSETGV